MKPRTSSELLNLVIILGLLGGMLMCLWIMGDLYRLDKPVPEGLSMLVSGIVGGLLGFLKAAGHTTNVDTENVRQMDATTGRSEPLAEIDRRLGEDR